MIHVSQDFISSVTNPITGELAHIYRFTLVNDITDMYVQVVSFGAAIYSLRVPDETGKVGEIILGFDYIQEYEKSRNTYFGATIGRVCNRIANGTFMIYDRKFEVTKNRGCNHIHGGRIGFDKVPWNLSEIHENGVTFSHRSPHGHEGYPGEVFATVRYTIHPDNSLRIYMTAKTDMTTLVNMTNHTYFNLAGHGAGREALYQHTVSIYANDITQTDPDGIPSGIYLPVDLTPYDFRTGENLGRNIRRIEGKKLGFDDNFCVIRDGLDENALAKVARVTHGPSGRWMEVESNQPGVQFYTGNFLPDDYKGRPPLLGREKTPYYKHGGFCLETQKYPDAPHHEHFPSIILRPGELYEHVINFKFGTLQSTAPVTKLTELEDIDYIDESVADDNIEENIYADISTEVESKSKSKSKSEGDSKSELPEDEDIAETLEEEKPHYSGSTTKRLKLDLEPVCVLKEDAAKMQEKQTEKTKEKVEEHVEANVVLDIPMEVETKSKSKSAGGQDDSKSELPEEENIAEAPEEKKPHYTGAIKKQPKLHLEPLWALREDFAKKQKKQREKAKEKVGEHLEGGVFLDIPMEVETKSKSKSPAGQGETRSKLPGDEDTAAASQEEKPHYSGAIKKQPKPDLEPVWVLREDVARMQSMQMDFGGYMEVRKKAKEEFAKKVKKFSEELEVKVETPASTEVHTEKKEVEVQTTPTITGEVKKKSVKVQTDPEKELEELEGACGGAPKDTVKRERLI